MYLSLNLAFLSRKFLFLTNDMFLIQEAKEKIMKSFV